MKKRNGFVSNSSSSSFIFAMPKEYNGKIKLTIEVDLTEFGKVMRTKNNLDKWYLEQSGEPSLDELFKDAPELKEEYNECLKQMWEGKTVIVGNVSNEGESGVEFILMEGNWTIDDPKVKQIGEISF